jgi:hypothetical protein
MSPSHGKEELKRIDAVAAASSLGNIFERLSRLEIVPHASKYGGLQFFELVPPTHGQSHALLGGLRREPPEFSRYDLMFSRSGAALWLRCNAASLFVELGKVVARKSVSGRLDPLRLTTLVIDFLTTQTSHSSSVDQSKDLAALMLSMGLGLLPVETDWNKQVRPERRGVRPDGKTVATGRRNPPCSPFLTKRPRTGISRFNTKGLSLLS